MSNEIEEKSKTFIGLDIGTESVGYAMTDEEYRVLNVSGKPCMGVRLFEEAQPSAERRTIRAAKVRQNRVKFRLTLLQELFEDEIAKVDPLFFIRLKASSYWDEDKKITDERLTELDSLFSDKQYKDKNHFNKFKTIYHLRDALMNEDYWNNSAPDIRFIYLACHHILKSRGHFLFEADDFNMSDAGKGLFIKLNEYIENANSEEISELPIFSLFNLDRFSEVELIAKNDKLNSKLKKEQLFNAFGFAKNKWADSVIRTILGADVKITDIFPKFEDAADLNKISLNSDWEETAPKLASALGDNFAFVEILKEIYDWFVLNQLLKGHANISSAMIAKYNKHESDLKALKILVKQNAKDKYYKIFRSTEEKANYAAYVGSSLNKGKYIVKKVKSSDEFYGFLKTELKGILPQEMLLDMDGNKFLPKLRTKDNSTVPYQLHKAELKKILQTASQFYSVDSDKIISLLSFRVPYYVGRLNGHYKNCDDSKHNVWIEKRQEYQNQRTRITPWNFNEIVDLDKSGESFITRMLSKCSYLTNETVLPKNSLTYSKFMVLNELNNLKIKSEPISINLKQQIFNELFKTQKTVTVSKLLSFLGKGIEKSDISGIDKEGKGFNTSLSSYVQAKAIFGEKINNENIQKIIEDVILWQALFTDKKQIENKIKKAYPDLTADTVKQLKGLNFSGFGNLSQKFLLSESVVCLDTGLITSILDLLWSTNENLMQIINNPKYSVEEWLNNENGLNDGVVDYSDIQKSYASPSVKRAVWQAMLIVDELIETTGKKPDKIFIEVTRSGKEEKNRSESRKTRLKKLWATEKSFDKIYPSLKEELEEKTDSELRGEKLFLYFLQCGKCAYSGETINISDISNDNLYDIDHIIPQALKKDDSLSNKVLVKKVLNLKKDKNYPLKKTNEIWSKKDILIPMWKSWLKCGLITEDKLQKLSRTTELNEKELEGFIARQLVFTGQSATIVAKLFKQKFTQTEIVYSKAENVSDFRKQFDILKCRDVNDLHHARDAYLNIVVGNTFNVRYNHARDFYSRKYDNTNEYWKTYTQNHLFEYDVPGAWKANQTIDTVKKYVMLNNLPVSKKTQENKGQFYKQNTLCALARQKEVLDGRKKLQDMDIDNTSLIPRKGKKNLLHNTQRYGGYTGLRPAYFMIIEHSTKKSERLREFIAISILDKKRWEKLSQEEQFKELSVKYISPKIIIPKVLIYTLFKIDKIECRLAGWDGTSKMGFHNAKQLFIDKESSDYIRIIAKFNEMIKAKKINIEEISGNEEIIVSDGRKKDSKILKLTKSDNFKLWDAFLEKINNLYGGMSEFKGRNLGLPDIYGKIANFKDEFANINIIRQINILNSLIVGLGCNANSFDLSEFGMGKSVGIIQPSSKITYPLIMINQSVTGLKEKEIKIYPFK